MVRMSFIAGFVLVTIVSRNALAGEPELQAPFRTERARQTVERAIGYLQTESGTWLRERKCAACHHAAMPMWALGEAERQGYPVNRKFLDDMAEGALGGPKEMIASKIAADPSAPPDPRPMAKGVNLGAVFISVAAQSLPSLSAGEKHNMSLIASDVVKKQRADGSWDFFLSRPPINENQATDAAWMLMALQGPSEPETAKPRFVALTKGMEWLVHAAPGDCEQVKVLKLLLQIRAGAFREKVQPDIDGLLALQRSDGGWGQTGGARSDAFATGQTLFVLSSAGCGAQQPEIRHAIDFLLDTQKPDGSWPMTSRATPDGRVGSAKLLTPITCAATAWATLGLTRAGPSK